MSAPETASPDVTTVGYARILYRFQALLIDAAVIMAAFAVILVGWAVLGDAIPAAIPIALLCGALIGTFLYEPLLVASRGMTVGHEARGLIVLDARGRRLSFGQALARYLIKHSLGIPSFFWMAMTRRYQSLHDLATHSYVRVGDPRVHPERVLLERAEPVGGGVPARRRVLVTVAYEVAALSIIVVPFATMSEACLLYEQCTNAETLTTVGATWTWLAVAGALLIFGWRGALPGARPSGRVR